MRGLAREAKASQVREFKVKVKTRQPIISCVLCMQFDSFSVHAI